VERFGYIPKFTGDVNAYDKIIIVSPIHSYGLPTLVYNFIANMKSAKPLYIVLNCGGLQANAPHFAYQLCKDIGLQHSFRSGCHDARNLYLDLFSAKVCHKKRSPEGP